MKKVLFLIHTLGAGGAEKVLINLVNNLDQSKYDITLMTVIDTGIFKQDIAKGIATQECVRKLMNSDEVYLIDYVNEYEARQKSWQFIFKGTIKEIAATMIKRVLFRNEFYKKRAFNEFICNEKVIPFDSVDKCSVLISGSDQIWNGKISNGIDRHFLLDFGNAIRKISIASSMGGYIISKQEKNVFRELLSKYDYISVREKFTKNQIEGIVDKNIYTILDPTLLIDATEWREIVVDNKKYIKYKFIPKSYILAFTIGSNHTNESELFKRYSEKYKLPVYKIMLNTFKPKGIDKVIPGANPYEFIDLIDNAAFVITNSFHGTAFSLNLNTPFVQIPVEGNNQRMQELLELVKWDETMNFENTNKIIKQKREDDIKWLKNALDV